MEFDHEGLVLFLMQNNIDFVWQKKSNIQSRFLMLIWMKYKTQTDPQLVRKVLKFLDNIKEPQNSLEQNKVLIELKKLIGDVKFNEIMSR